MKDYRVKYEVYDSHDRVSGSGDCLVKGKSEADVKTFVESRGFLQMDHGYVKAVSIIESKYEENL